MQFINFQDHQTSVMNNSFTPKKYNFRCEWGEDQVYNSALLSSSMLFPYAAIKELVCLKSIKNRSKAVEWIRKVLSGYSFELCETSINILDSFLIVSYKQDNSVLDDSSFIAFAATASMILSSKLHNSTNPISASSFSRFNTDDLLLFEQQIVLKIPSRMNISVTSASFLQYFVSKCDMFPIKKDVLFSMAMDLIAEFHEDKLSLLFAPSTIAISAIVVSLSYLKIHCQSFLELLPDYFFPHSKSESMFSVNEDKNGYLNFEFCIQEMEKLPIIRRQYNNKSPDGVNNLD